MKYLIFLMGVITLFAILFHYIMLHVEGVHHSWVTGFYWTLTVMSTLGFGDITFESDIGRLFSMVVLLAGIILLLIVLPFAFIRYFYAPLLESRLRNRAPRTIPEEIEGHVVICSYDSIAKGFIRKLNDENIPYFVLEEDPDVAADWHMDGISVILCEIDNVNTYKDLNLDRASMVLVNREDTLNTKIILSITSYAPKVPLIALANEDDSVDVLQLSGATHVLPLKRWLGEQLASRIRSVRPESHSVGRYEDLVIAEFPVYRTPMANKTVRETRLRQATGISIIGIWERGRLQPVHPDKILTNSNVLVVIGTENQLKLLDKMIEAEVEDENPVVVIGGGRVGAAAIEAMWEREIPVNLVERDPDLCRKLNHMCKGIYSGDAADYDLLRRAGIMDAPSVLLTTNDDSMNVHLSSYCRQLNKDLRIISRITHERNLDIIHRAGADFVLSYASLGAEAVFSLMKGQELIILGEGISLFTVPTPPSLYNKTLVETEIGAKTGLSVIAIQENHQVNTRISGSTVLPPDSGILMLGDNDQRQEFIRLFENANEKA